MPIPFDWPDYAAFVQYHGLQTCLAALAAVVEGLPCVHSDHQIEFLNMLMNGMIGRLRLHQR